LNNGKLYAKDNQDGAEPWYQHAILLKFNAIHWVGSNMAYDLVPPKWPLAMWLMASQFFTDECPANIMMLKGLEGSTRTSVS